ncbi:MAG: TonB-dependent receptor [Acidobacteriota bacterium]
MRSPLFLRCFAVLFIVSVLAVPLLAQSGRGSINGLITDATGAVVPGVEVVITDQATGVETKALTTDAGVYRAPYVSPGKYKITASLPGFKTAVAENVEVGVGQTVNVDFKLEIGEVSEQVTVSSVGPLLETSTPEIGINTTEKEVHTWPILVGDGTRQLQQFIFTSMPGTQGGTFEGTINGGQAYSHEILIDGITIGRYDLNGGSNNEFTPTMDAVSEFKLHTGALSSQYGNTQTALANFGLKSGTNAYHGTAFWFHRNKSLNANSWGGNRLGRKKAPFLENNFGATFGGPIIKDKTHFFVSYEGDRFNDQTISGSLDSMPIAAFRQGNFARLLDPAFTRDARSGTVVGTDALGRNIVFGQLYDPTSARLVGTTWVRDPFPGNVIPSNRISAVTLNALKHDIPLPQLDLFRFNAARVNPGQPILTIDNFGLKMDHVLNGSHKMAGSVTHNDRSRLRYNGGYRPPGIGIPGPAAVGDRTQATPGVVVRLSEDWTVSPTMLNHIAIGYNRFRNANQSNSFVKDGRNWAQALGLVNVGSATFPQISFGGNNTTLSGGYGALGDGGTSNNPNGSVVVLDDFTWLRGAHSFRLGVEHRRYFLNAQSTFSTGSYAFHSENTAAPGFTNQTGFGYASFMLGAVRNAGLGIPLVNFGTRSRTTGFYLQDDWKVRPNLTLNLGVRWDIPTPFTEAANRMSGLDPTKPNPGADGFRGALVFVGDCSACIGRNAFTETNYKQVAPRVGFAYAAMNNKFVLRGGYGINFSPPILDGFNFPYTAGFNGSNPYIARSGRFLEDPSYFWDTPYKPFTQVLPNFNPAQRNGDSIGWYQPETKQLPYVQNWNLGVQMEAPWKTKLEINYIGNKGTHLNEDNYEGALNMVDPKWLSLGNKLLDNINLHPDIPKPYPSFTGTVARALRPFPQFETLEAHRLNGGSSKYHSLQVTGIKRSTSGLSFLAAYTFSKALATSDTAGPGVYDYGQNYYNRRSDYSVTLFHVPQDLKLTWIYEFPFGPGRPRLQTGVLSRVLGGWTVSSIQRYRSGPPVSISGANFDGQALFGPGGFRGDVLLPRNQQVLGKEPSDVNPIGGTPYLNPAAFGAPPATSRNVPIRFGNAPRYLPDLRGFAIYSEDLSLIKQTHLGFREGANFELRMDVVNLFNRVRMGGPITNVTDPQFGKIFGKAGGPRQIQVGARISF